MKKRLAVAAATVEAAYNEDLVSEDNGFLVEVFGNEWEIVR